jgi:hypothetical protein
MRVVADKLAEWAINETDESDADAFGRSAFNRYYYASYLITREMLSELNSSWTRTGHKQIPDLLKNSVIKKIRQELRRKLKAGLIRISDAARYRSSANSAVSNLSNLLQQAYNTRVIADYEPDTRIVRVRREIHLRNEKLGTAQSWPNRVFRYTRSILIVWKQLGLS